MNKFSVKFETTINDFDRFEDIKASAILNYFQEIAVRHADNIKLGYNELLKLDRLWLLCDSKFLILKDIKVNSTINIETWVNKMTSAIYHRHFIIKNVNNEILVKGESRWVIIDKNSGTVIRLKEDIYEFVGVNEYSFEEKFCRTVKKDGKYLGEYSIGYDDIDKYFHMNNVKYVELVYKFIGKKMNSCLVSYYKQVFFKDKLSLYLNTDNKSTIMGYNQNGEFCFGVEFD